MTEFAGVRNVIAELERYGHDLYASRQAHLDRADRDDEKLVRIGSDLADLRSALAVVDGRSTELLPADVQASDSPPSLTIGGLKLAPHPEDASSLKRFASVMRALYETSTHLARVATDMADALDPEAAHVRRQAVTETQQLPAATGTPGLDTGICRNCKVEVYRNDTHWKHHPSGMAQCHPGESFDEAEPMEALCLCNRPGDDPWCSVHPPSYPAAPSVAPPAVTVPDTAEETS